MSHGVFWKYRTAATTYLFSANGATCSASLGQRPRGRGTPETMLALKARFTSGIEKPAAELTRAFSAWLSLVLDSWGDAPGWHETAPLALIK